MIVLSTIVVGQNIVSKKQLDGPKFYRSFGDFLLEKGYNEQALKSYEKGLELNPDDKFLLNNIGFYYKDINPLLAEEYLKKALEIDSDYENARSNLALLYNKMADYENSITQFSILVNSFPNKINYQYDLSINLANKYYYVSKEYNDLVMALEGFKKVYLINPNFEHVMDNIRVLNEIKNLLESN